MARRQAATSRAGRDELTVFSRNKCIDLCPAGRARSITACHRSPLARFTLHNCTKYGDEGACRESARVERLSTETSFDVSLARHAAVFLFDYAVARWTGLTVIYKLTISCRIRWCSHLLRRHAAVTFCDNRYSPYNGSTVIKRRSTQCSNSVPKTEDITITEVTRWNLSWFFKIISLLDSAVNLQWSDN